jgi:23S rRNA (uracil-5-)-methyltransferase RumA
MQQKIFTVKTDDSIAHNGAAKGIVNGEAIYIHGLIPGETAIVDASRKHGSLFGDIREVIEVSPSRKTPEELHYMSCSPWQVIEYPKQVGLKHEILADLFSYYNNAPKVQFTPADKYYGYRTKVEYSFIIRDSVGVEIPLSLAFHIRNAGKSRVELPKGCELLSENVNSIALKICEKLRNAGLTTYELKSLCIRESKTTNSCIAILYVKDKIFQNIDVYDIPNLVGFHVWYSTHKSPAVVATEKIYGSGDDFLEEKIGGIKLKYPWDGFFQNNISVFERAVSKMSEYVNKENSILELYSGVGTIGLILADKVKHVYGVEINQSSVDFAKENAIINEIDNYESECLPAEKINSDLINKYDTLIVDPPRAGLHPKLIDQIMMAKPETIIYLSCNPETQSRDYSKIKDLYKIEHIEGFDFYPQTPHLESLMVLKKI